MWNNSRTTCTHVWKRRRAKRPPWIAFENALPICLSLLSTHRPNRSKCDRRPMSDDSGPAFN